MESYQNCILIKIPRSFIVLMLYRKVEQFHRKNEFIHRKR